MELLEKCELYSQGKICLVGPWREKKTHKIGAGYIELYRQMPRGSAESHAYGAQMDHCKQL